MNFWTVTLAVFVGSILVDFFEVLTSEQMRKFRRWLADRENRGSSKSKDISAKGGKKTTDTKKRDTYSPEVSGRRAIGFEACKERMNETDGTHDQPR